MAETEIKHREKILEAIDQLRKRKARPDSIRICNYMQRRFNVDQEETKQNLEKCIKSEIVFKVEYKGDISYRNAAKWHQKHRSGDIIDSTIYSDKKVRGSFSKIVSLSVSELICQEPDFLELGVPGQALCKTILSKSLVKYTKKHLTVLLAHEVAKGGLVKLDNGYYSLGSNLVDTDKSDEDYTEEVERNRFPYVEPEQTRIRREDTNAQETEQKQFRVGQRKKLAKKVFDPSDNNLPKRKRGRPMGAITKEKPFMKKNMPSHTNYKLEPSSTSGNQVGACTICREVKKNYERFVPCQGCSKKAHVSCLPNSNAQLNWQCYQCKGCAICFNSLLHRTSIVCSICANAFHTDCHIPKIDPTRDQSEPWICLNCANTDCLIRRVKTEPNSYDSKIEGMSSTRSDSSMSTPPPTLSPQNRTSNDNNSTYSSDSKNSNVYIDEQESNKSFEPMEDFDPTIPDATSWTPNEVYHYFSQYFPQEATIFRDQEIDGHSLLLMKRKDVLTNLQLKLGPALKIYRHVLRLQLRKDDVKLGWF